MNSPSKTNPDIAIQTCSSSYLSLPSSSILSTFHLHLSARSSSLSLIVIVRIGTFLSLLSCDTKHGAFHTLEDSPPTSSSSIRSPYIIPLLFDYQTLPPILLINFTPLRLPLISLFIPRISPKSICSLAFQFIRLLLLPCVPFTPRATDMAAGTILSRAKFRRMTVDKRIALFLPGIILAVQ